MSIETLARAIGLELNEEQQKAVAATAWFYDVIGGRRTGRTTLLILGAFNMAMSQPGTMVFVMDHWASTHLGRISIVQDWAEILTRELKLAGHFVISRHPLSISFLPTPPVFVDVERLEGSER
jgi:hypothetical protein